MLQIEVLFGGRNPCIADPHSTISYVFHMLK
jgi:hypothetical protein